MPSYTFTFRPLLCVGETIELLDIGLQHSKDHNEISFGGSNPPAMSSPDRNRALASVPLAIKPISNSERKKDTTHKTAVSIGSPQDM